MTERMVEYPRPLADVPDPCTQTYYPEWSSRGMRAVRCTRRARATLMRYDPFTPRRVCGIHANYYGPPLVVRDGAEYVEPKEPTP